MLNWTTLQQARPARHRDFPNRLSLWLLSLSKPLVLVQVHRSTTSTTTTPLATRGLFHHACSFHFKILKFKWKKGNIRIIIISMPPVLSSKNNTLLHDAILLHCHSRLQWWIIQLLAWTHKSPFKVECISAKNDYSFSPTTKRHP